MNKAKRQIFISLALGAFIEAALFGLCHVTAHDFVHEGPDTPLSRALTYASMWSVPLLRFIPFLSQDSGAIYVFLFGLPALVYGFLAHVLLSLLQYNRTKPTEPVV